MLINKIDTGQNRLRTSDPRLPLLASQAAIELDNAIQGNKIEFKSAKRLAEFLKDSLECPVGAPTEKLSLDVSTVGIIGRALNNSAWKGSIKTVQQVVDEANEIANKIEKISSDIDRSSLLKLKAFCVAFGNNLIAYRESLRDFRPSSPYKR